MSYNAKNYTEQGGDVTHIGGKLVFESGNTVENFPSSVIPDASESTRGLVKQASNQLASSATTVDTLKADFNSLLLKLKTAGLIAADPESEQ